MRKVRLCFGFVSDLGLCFTQVSDILVFNLKRSLSCTDHQLYSTSLVKAHLTGLKLLGFFYFSEPKIKLPHLRFNANTRNKQRFECFGFVSGEFWPAFLKQNPLISFLPTEPVGGAGILCQLFTHEKMLGVSRKLLLCDSSTSLKHTLHNTNPSSDETLITTKKPKPWRLSGL